MSLSFKRFGKLFGIALLCLSFLFSTNIAQTKKVTKTAVKKSAQSDLVKTQNLEEIRKKGFAFIQAGDWASANSAFENALAIAPKDALSLYGKALALFNLKRVSEAEVKLGTVIEILSPTKENRPLLADSLVLSAVISAVQNKNSLAIEKLEKAISLVPTHFDANFSLGRAYFGNGEIDKAVNSFRQSVSLQPSNMRARFFLATALERAGNMPEALAEYRKVLELNPNSADGNLGLGVLLIKTEGDKSEDGLKVLQKAVTLNPNLYEAQITLGKTLIRLNRAAEAIGHLQKAAELAPNNPEPHFQLALAYRKLGKKAEAEAETEIVKKIHENRREFRLRSLRRSSRNEEVI